MSKGRVGILIFLVVLFSLVTTLAAESSLGVFPTGQDINVIQLCATCTSNNITSITYPNSTEAVGFVQMTRNGSQYNYTLSNTIVSVVGNYKVNGIGDINGENEIWVTSFEITKTGTQLNTGKAIIYVLLAAGVLLLFFLSLYVTIMIPYSNEVDVRGMVINVTKKKYWKLLFVFLTHILLVWFLNTIIAVSDNFVELPQFFGFLSFMFSILNRLALPMGIVLLIIMFFEIVRDANIQKRIELFGKGTM